MSGSSASRLPFRRWIPRAALVLGVIVTLVATWFVLRNAQTRETMRFNAAVEETARAIESRLNTYVELLRAGAALFTASGEVTAAEFRDFTNALRVDERYPGIQGIGFSAVFTREELAARPTHAFDPRRLGLMPWPEGERPEYTAIVYLEPQDERNRRAMGYDMFTDSVRRRAMARARDTGEPTASGLVTLVQETGSDIQPGFLIYVPVYRAGAPRDSAQERRRALRGYVYSPFRGDDLLTGTLPGQADVWFRVYTDPDKAPSQLLHASAVAGNASGALLRQTAGIEVAGRTWTIDVEAARPFRGPPPWAPVLTLTLGLLLSAAAFTAMRAQLDGWEAVTRHAAELAESEEALRRSGERLEALVALEREARDEAQRANRAKDEFLATLSHELRTPLNAVLGWTTMLRSGGVRPDARADALSIIERNARLQARLIEDLLDSSRIVSGKIRLDRERLHLDAAVRTATEALRPDAAQKGLALRTAVREAVPILGDTSRVHQIVWNLVANAVKFTPPGGQVDVGLVTEDDAAVLTVRDTGIGMDAAFIPHAFERFRQADSSTTREYGGVGLGLAIVQHLADLHGATVEAWSEGRDCGSTFVVRFPLLPAGAPVARDAIGSEA